MGKKTQQKKDEASRRSVEQPPSAQSPLGGGVQTGVHFAPGTAVFETSSLSDNIIEFDKDQDDTVSMLEDPTIITKDVIFDDHTASISGYDFHLQQDKQQSTSTLMGGKTISDDEDSIEQLFNQ